MFKDAVFLAPKVYAGLTLENKEIMKIKGYKYKVPFKEFKKLIMKDYNLELLTTYNKLNGLSLFMKVI